MKKRTAMIIIIAIIPIVGGIFFLSISDHDTVDQHANQQSNKESSDNKNKEPGEATPSLDSIFDLAEQGKIPGGNIVVGETTADEVQKSWGKPEETSDTVVGLFLNYPSYDMDVGITDGVVFDMRSSQEQFTSVDFNTIQSYKKPDDTRYYQDEDDNQIILVYELPNDYILKWVLPKPSNHLDNPHVDHISLSKEKGKVNGNRENVNDFGSVGIEEMSLDEKIGQMIFSGVNGTEMTTETKNMIQDYHVGGIILFAHNIQNKTQTVDFLNKIKTANTDNPYPLLLGVDEEGGRVTRIPKELKSLPSARSIGEMNDPDLAFEAGTIMGEQMKALGFNLNFAPVLDVNSNPNNPVIGDRSFGDNLDIVTRLGVQSMKGIQNEGIISVMKHFPGHGDTDVDSHVGLPKVNKSYKALSELELVPFKDAISEGADVSMMAHILLSNIDEDYPASMSKKVITGILREDYGFDGVVITDDLTMSAITDHYRVSDAVVHSVKAGADLLLIAHDPNLIAKVFDSLKASVENGEISEDRIDESVERIINLKAKYELSDEKNQIPDVQPINKKVEAIWQKVS